jgi:hypothetical protein
MSDLFPSDHNNPPPEERLAVDLHNARLQDLVKLQASIALPLTAETAPLMRDVMGGARDLVAAAERKRKEIQLPFESRLNAIRALFKGLTDRSEALKLSAQSHLNAYLAAEDLRIKEEAAAASAKADALAAEAEALADEATAFGGFAEASDAAKDAAMAKAEADHSARAAANGPRVASASGSGRAAGYRTSWSVTVEDSRKMVHYYRDHPSMIELAAKLAAADVRAAKGVLRKPIPGVSPLEVRSAV